MANPLPIEPLRLEDASEDVRACLTEIQDTMGIPWVPSSWRAYAHYPDTLRYLWSLLKPAVASERFIKESLELTEHAYRDVSRWYQPTTNVDIPEDSNRQIQWELDAFEYGNPQLLIQQAALTRLLRGERIGSEGIDEPRARPSSFREPAITLKPPSEATPEMQGVFEDIQRSLDMPLVEADFQALAKWPAFLYGAWEDVKQQHQHDVFHVLERELTRMADEASCRLRPSMQIDEGKLRDTLGEGSFEELRRVVDAYTLNLPRLIVSDAMFRVFSAGGRPVSAPSSAGSGAPRR